jgi:dipeptidyl aminopeptidase/acylaminoacyl peptidase
MNGDLSVARVTQERRVSVVATAPDGSRAAAVFLTTDGGREAEEIRIVQSEGEESEPIYGPEIVGNPGGNPRVLSLVWSPDGSQVAVIRSDGSIWLAGPEREPEALFEGGGGAVEKLVWAPSGTGFALLTRQPSGAGVVDVVALDGGETVSIAPDASFGDVAWLPGQALLVATEDRRGGATPAAGSLFTFRPDGAERELLLSAGEFGPVVEITQLTPSPDGQLLAFVVKVPNPEGLLQFHALYVREIESGVLRELAVAAGQGVNDLWWLEGGRLAWRATPAQPDNVYDGAEPFIIEVGILETGETQFVYTTE